ncbi:MAG: hypothetical protein OXD38_02705 [Aestuariivita sp.]|nr:hypothetical protein [Aestuariivita sp.]
MPATIFVMSSAPFLTDYSGLFRASIQIPEDGWDTGFALLKDGLITSEDLLSATRACRLQSASCRIPMAGSGTIPTPKINQKGADFKGKLSTENALKSYPHPLTSVLGLWII